MTATSVPAGALASTAPTTTTPSKAAVPDAPTTTDPSPTTTMPATAPPATTLTAPQPTTAPSPPTTTAPTTPSPATATTCAGTTLSVTAPNGQSASQSLGAGQCLVNGQFETLMQTDGNLVTYDQTKGAPVWASGTVGNPGASLVLSLTPTGISTTFAMQVVAANGGTLWSVGGPVNGYTTIGGQLIQQSGGNLQFYGFGSFLWQSGTQSTAYSLLLQPGQSITSTNGLFQLVMQTDGNLVVYLVAQGDALWSTGTQNNPGAVAAMQDDGNLVVYSEGGTALWASGTTAPNSTLALQNDGNLVIYGANSAGQYPVWSSHTDNVRGYELTSGQLLQPGQYLASQNRQYVLEMSSGGNLTISSIGQYICPMWSVPAVTTSTSQTFPPQPGAYLQLTSTGDLALWHPGQTSGSSLWDAGTSGGETAVLQNDGDLVVNSSSGATLWSSGTSSNRGGYLCAGSTLSGGQQLEPWNDTDTSNVFPQSGSSLSMQADCNLVLYNAGTVVWASNTDESQADPQGFASGMYNGCYATMQTQGNLVIYAPNDGYKVLWASGTEQGTPEAVPPVVGPVYLIPIVATTTIIIDTIPTTIPSGTLNIYSSAGPLLGTPLPATSGGATRWIVSALNTLVFYLGVPGSPVGTAATVLGGVDTAISDLPAVGQGSGGSAAQASPTPASSTPRPDPASGTGPTAPSTAPPPVTTCTVGSPNQLVGGGQIAPGGCLRSANGGYELVMQTDGNLVLYGTLNSDVLWSTNTAGNPGAYLRLQADDGNLVESNQAGTAALWSTGVLAPRAILTLQNDGNLVLTANNEAASTGAVPYAAWATGTQSFRGSTLPPGQVLQPGQYLQNGQFRLTMGATGLLVLSQTTASSTVCPMWTVPAADASLPDTSYDYTGSFSYGFVSTPPTPGAYLAMQTQGNLVLYPPQAGAALFSTPTADSPGSYLTLSTSGIVAVQAADGAVQWQALPANDEGLMLCAGGSLSQGQYITGDQPANGTTDLVMQSDCNLVLTVNGTPTWSSDTDVSQAGQGKNPLSASAAAAGDYNGCYVQMQTDGNLVMYAPGVPNGTAMWASNSEQSSVFSLGRNIGPYYVTTGSDGYARIYNLLGTQLWDAGAGAPSSGTNGSTGQKTAQTVFEILGLLAGFV
ncbi:MAG TPA: hypothetical protein VHU17_00985 [Acidimicrobiales bacterium]|nr:hypothetical protein [Acidimicrobiales bacterium]